MAETPERYCGNCGRELGQDYRFCPNCGTERRSPTRGKAAPAPTFTPEDILASLEQETGEQEQVAEGPPIESEEPLRERAQVPTSPPGDASPRPPSANEPVAPSPLQEQQVVDSKPEASEANNAGFRIERTPARLLGALVAACLVVIWLAAGAPVAVLTLIVVVALVRYAYKIRQKQSLADTPAMRSQQEQEATNRRGEFYENAFVLPFTFVFTWIALSLLVFGVALLFGSSSGNAMVIGVFGGFVWAVISIMGLKRERQKNHRVHTRPTHSRNIPQWVKIAVATRDGGKCRRCGSAYDLQYDHIIPYSRGGSSTDVDNIQLLCGWCNRLKSNRYIG